MPLPNNIASATITLYKINEVSIYKSELITAKFFFLLSFI